MPGLASLSGVEPPESLIREIRFVLDLPEGTVRTFWFLLSLALHDDPPDDLKQHIERSSKEHDVEPDLMAGALRGHRFLLREAARRNVTKEDYAADLATLAGDPGQAERLQALLLPGFDLAMERVKQEIIGAGVADHGKVLTGVKWRVDAMLASDRGSAEQRRIGMLTLIYREGRRGDRITLQVQPDGLQALYEACKGMIEVE
jgi:hypothetical protein